MNIQINFSDLNPVMTGMRLLVVAKAVSKESRGRLSFSVMRNSSTILGQIKNNNSTVEPSWIVLQVNYSPSD